jgi:hypothetical protein
LIPITEAEAQDLVRFMDRQYLNAATYPALKELIDRLGRGGRVLIDSFGEILEVPSRRELPNTAAKLDVEKWA